jgi:hypothetical protein
MERRASYYLPAGKTAAVHSGKVLFGFEGALTNGREDAMATHWRTRLLGAGSAVADALRPWRRRDFVYIAAAALAAAACAGSLFLWKFIHRVPEPAPCLWCSSWSASGGTTVWRFLRLDVDRESFSIVLDRAELPDPRVAESFRREKEQDFSDGLNFYCAMVHSSGLTQWNPEDDDSIRVEFQRESSAEPIEGSKTNILYKTHFTGPSWALLWIAWLSAIAPAAVTTMLIGRLRRNLRVARAIRNGTCVHCGYDLRASKERCPECGAPFPPAKGPGTFGAGPPPGPPPT